MPTPVNSIVIFLPVLNNLGAFAEYSISSGNQHLLYLAESNI